MPGRCRHASGQGERNGKDGKPLRRIVGMHDGHDPEADRKELQGEEMCIRDSSYDAVMLSVGGIGFSMGATANGLANMQAISEKYGSSPESMTAS